MYVGTWTVHLLDDTACNSGHKPKQLQATDTFPDFLSFSRHDIENPNKHFVVIPSFLGEVCGMFAMCQPVGSILWVQFY